MPLSDLAGCLPDIRLNYKVKVMTIGDFFSSLTLNERVFTLIAMRCLRASWSLVKYYKTTLPDLKVVRKPAILFLLPVGCL